MRWALVLAAMLGWSCENATEIEVVVTTDLPCDELLGTGIAVGAPGELGSTTFAGTTHDCDGGFIGSLVIVPSGAGDTVGIEVVGNTASNDPEACDRDTGVGCIIAKRELAFVPHTPLYLPIALEQSCIGHVCSGATTCVAGVCRTAIIPNPAICASDASCGEGTLGDAGSPTVLFVGDLDAAACDWQPNSSATTAVANGACHACFDGGYVSRAGTLPSDPAGTFTFTTSLASPVKWVIELDLFAPDGGPTYRQLNGDAQAAFTLEGLGDAVATAASWRVVIQPNQPTNGECIDFKSSKLVLQPQ